MTEEQLLFQWGDRMPWARHGDVHLHSSEQKARECAASWGSVLVRRLLPDGPWETV